MDIYSTSFTHPRRTRHLHSDFPHSHPPPQPDPAAPEDVEKLALLAMTIHGVQVSYLPADQRGWNFYVSGAYQQVMAARGMLLKDSPVQVPLNSSFCQISSSHVSILPQHRTSIKVARADILDAPSSKPTLKPDVRRKLDDIAGATLAHIAVVNSPLTLSSRTPPDGVNSAGWSGLETERVCELVITGQGDATELARVRLLVMLDELSGLHAEMCEIDQKLHAIVAGRKRHVLQSIQEDTGTNIYFPSPLQALVGPDIVPSAAAPPGTRQGPNLIWITGEFFGVQRAKDMLYQLAASKVCIAIFSLLRDANAFTETICDLA
ncbi:hypothetical protein AZE42_02563 [Rhizopogon vesiculosus]|uniref:K Homology domain-containing protein n=1 Tax=Rhizopogon vesiculosus TaxID=180088 RepID=A0A1J8Q722_9AGAM|nr:hypothetical protein AZE42_02563 [Rhizopogon vesiculosus]